MVILGEQVDTEMWSKKGETSFHDRKDITL